VTATFEL
jgi:competence protein ComEC